MDPRSQALAVDYSLAVGAVTVGVLAGAGRSPWSLPFALLGFSALVGPLYLAEHADVLALVDEHRPLSLVVAGLATLAVAGSLVVGRILIPFPEGALLAGMGVGLWTYRTVFGLVYPVPDSRLAGTTDW